MSKSNNILLAYAKQQDEWVASQTKWKSEHEKDRFNHSDQPEKLMPLSMIPDFNVEFMSESVDWDEYEKDVKWKNIWLYSDPDTLSDWCTAMLMNSDISISWIPSKYRGYYFFMDESSCALLKCKKQPDEIFVDTFAEYIMSTKFFA